MARDENIRYIRRYISDISDIGDIRHDIGDDRYIGFGPIYHENIRSMEHARVSLMFR